MRAMVKPWALVCSASAWAQSSAAQSPREKSMWRRRHRRLHPPIMVPPRMGRQHGRRLGINTAALGMALALTRSQATSKVPMAAGTFAARRLSPNVVCRAMRTRSSPISSKRVWVDLSLEPKREADAGSVVVTIVGLMWVIAWAMIGGARCQALVADQGAEDRIPFSPLQEQ